MQQPIGVVKDIPLGNLFIAIVLAKLRKRPVSDVLPAIRAVFVVGIEGKALCVACKVKIGDTIRAKAKETRICR